MKEIVTKEVFEIFINNSKRVKKGYFLDKKTNFFTIGSRKLAFVLLKNLKGEVFGNIVYEEGKEQPVSYEIIHDVTKSNKEQLKMRLSD